MIALLAIEEVHRLFQWGHYFRTDYLTLGELPERFRDVPRIALTAVTTPATHAELTERLRSDSADHFVANFGWPTPTLLPDFPRS